MLRNATECISSLRMSLLTWNIKFNSYPFSCSPCNITFPFYFSCIKITILATNFDFHSNSQVVKHCKNIRKQNVNDRTSTKRWASVSVIRFTYYLYLTNQLKLHIFLLTKNMSYSQHFY